MGQWARQHSTAQPGRIRYGTCNGEGGDVWLDGWTRLGSGWLAELSTGSVALQKG
jgi:hypothetical protein